MEERFILITDVDNFYWNTNSSYMFHLDARYAHAIEVTKLLDKFGDSGYVYAREVRCQPSEGYANLTDDQVRQLIHQLIDRRSKFRVQEALIERLGLQSLNLQTAR